MAFKTLSPPFYEKNWLLNFENGVEDSYGPEGSHTLFSLLALTAFAFEALLLSATSFSHIAQSQKSGSKPFPISCSGRGEEPAL